MDTLRTFDPAGERYDDLLLLQGAAEEAVRGYLARARVVTAAAGETVLEANRPNDTIYVVLDGTLRIELVETDTGAAVHVGRGECVGELSVIDHWLTSAQVRAVNACELLALNGMDVLALADRSHAVASNLLRLLSQRIRSANALVRQHAEQSALLRMRAVTDALTGLYNRRWLDETLSRLADRADHESAHRNAFGVLLIDLDHFKAVNDAHGHLAGDRVLQAVSEAIRLALRPTDYAARYGGEELAVVLPGVADEATAAAVGERMRAAVARLRIAASADVPLRVTVSVGAVVRRPGEQPDSLLARADKALYAAKHAGRDRVVRFAAVGD